jgi:serine kinase of HPr protein (carbohydrate metabolism regulator)
MHLNHATCVAVAGKGVLLRGFSGAGKSDLALRLIDGGAELVADDQVVCHAEGGAVIATAPPAIAGLLEVRGLGVMHLEFLGRVEIALVVDLVAPERVARMPVAAVCEIAGIELPLLELAPFEASTPTKLRLACQALARGEILGDDMALLSQQPA